MVDVTSTNTVFASLASERFTRTGVINGRTTVSYENSNAAVTLLNFPGAGPSLGGFAFGDLFVGIDNLIGSQFNDAITSTFVSALVDGRGGDDLINTGAGDDTLLGGAGQDILVGGAGADSLDGGADFDIAAYWDSDASVTVDLANTANNTGWAVGDIYVSVERFFGSNFDDILLGSGGIDFFNGALGADLILGRAGNDFLEGEGGDDTIDGGEGADVILGGDGIDTASYVNADSGVTVSLSDNKLNTGEALGDELIGIENLSGSGLSDMLIGDSAANLLSGNNGDDTLEGGLAADTLDGANGNDTASYLAAAAGVRVDLTGEFSAQGEAAADILISIENLTGSNFDDTLLGGKEDNVLDGRDGNDYLAGRGGNDSLLGGSGSDIVNGGEGADSLDGGDGFDLAAYFDAAEGIVLDLLDSKNNTGEAEGDVFTDIEAYYGTIHADTISGTLAADILYGNFGEDLLIGLAGDDQLDGGLGNDTLRGGSGADRMFGDEGTDTASYADALTGFSINLTTGIHTGDAQDDVFISIENIVGSKFGDAFIGDENNNSFDGAGGNDYLQGYGGDDTLLGGNGDDIMVGNSGADAFDGGDGFDIVAYWDAGAAVVVDLTNPSNNTNDAEGDTYANIEVIFGSIHNDTIIGGNEPNYFVALDGDDLVQSGGGTDYIEGGQGNDSIDAGDGDDIIYGGVGADTMDGGAGYDTLYFFNSQAGVNVDLANGEGAGGEADGDVYFNVEAVIGSMFDDRIIGDLEGIRALNRGGIDNAFYGLAGDDTLEGGMGDDVLAGGADNDILIGGEGSDLAYFEGVRAAFFITRADDLLDGKAALSVNGFPLAPSQGRDIVTGAETYDFFDRTFNFEVLTVDDTASTDVVDTVATGNVVTNDIGSTLILDAGDKLAPTVVGIGYGGDFDYYLSYVLPQPGLSVTGKYGTIDIAEDGSYRYELNSMDEDFLALRDGETAIETFEYLVTPGDTEYHDLASVISSGFLNITVTGTNHAPEVDLDTIGNGRNGLNNGDFITAASSGILGSRSVFISGNPGGDSNAWTGDSSTSTFAGKSDTLVSDFDVSALVPNYKSVTFTLAVSNNVIPSDTAFDAGESIRLSDGGIASIDFLGYSYSATATSITVTALADNLMTGKFVTSLVKAVTYTNNQSDFGLNVNDRVVTVTATDKFNASDSATTNIGIRADVVYVSGTRAFTGGYLSDSIQGGSGNETINGGDGNDTITGFNALNFSGGGTNTLFGQGGNDTFIGGINLGITQIVGTDSFDGGAGNDTVDYSASNKSVTVNLSNTSNVVGDVRGTGTGGHANNDTYTSIENIIGSANADTLTGSLADNVITGGGGNDLIAGLAGADTLTGSAGSRDVSTYAASDAGVTVSLAVGAVNKGGHAEGDVLASIEDLTGSDLNDSLTGDVNSNRLLGGIGNDSLSGAGGSDTLDGGSGNDDLAFETVDGTASVTRGASLGGGSITGAGLNDTLLSIEHVELTGGDGNDGFVVENVRGSGFSLDIEGGAGDDTVTVGTGYTGPVTFLLADSLFLPPYTGSNTLFRGVYDGTPLTSLKINATFSEVETVEGGANTDFFAWDAKDGDYTADGKGGFDTLIAAYVPEVVLGNSAELPPVPRLVASFTLTSTAIDLVTSLEVLPPPPPPPIEPAALDAPVFESFESSIQYSNMESVIIAGFDGQIDVLDFSGAAEGGTAHSDGYVTGFGLGRLTVQTSDIDVLIGSAEGDVLIGDDLAETLVGGAGKDSLTGAANNDRLDGGDDFDTAVFNTKLSESTLTVETDGGFVTAVTQVSSTANGTDTLIRIEALQFSDVTLNLESLVQLFDSGRNLIGTFGTITEALTAAKNNTGSDELIRVRDGEYFEQLIIDGSTGTLEGLEIRGESQSGVIIKAPGTGLVQTGRAGDLLSLHAIIAISNFDDDDQLDLTDLTIDGAGALLVTPSSFGAYFVGLQVTGVADISLDDITVQGIALVAPEVTATDLQPAGIGIYADNQGISDGEYFELDDGTVTGFSQTGLWLLGVSGLDIDDSTITGSGPTSAYRQTGILVGNGSSGDIEDNTINGLEYLLPETIDGDQEVQASGFALISDNVAAGIRVVDEIGTAASNLDIIDNTITGGAVVVTDAEPVLTPPATGFAGIVLLPWVDGSDILIENNDISNAGYGVVEEPSGEFDENELSFGAEGDVNSFDNIAFYNYQLNSDQALTVDIDREGTEGADSMLGAGGNDTLIGGGGNDVIAGSEDLAAFAAFDAYPDEDVLEGGDGDDTISGGAGNDSLLGGEGNDLLDGGVGADTLDGANGIDTADYSGATSTLTASLANAADNIGYALGDVLTNVENILGGDFNDLLIGNGNANELTGGLGNDTLVGGAGADSLNGGDGTDIASYRFATSGLAVSLNDPAANTGEAKDDVYTSIEGLEGGNFNDTLTGDTGDNLLLGGDGDDLLASLGGVDTLIGGAGFDTATYASSKSAIVLNLTNTDNSTGDAARNLFFSIEQWVGTGFDDKMLGNGDANIFDGGAGNDSLDGGSGADTLLGGEGDDILDGGLGIDSLVGGAENDTYRNVDRADLVVEAADGGIDTVETPNSYVLGDNVENLTLTNGIAPVTFEDYGTGPLADGEEGWQVGSTIRDVSIVDLGGAMGNVFKISSDPASPDFSGTYSVPLTALTGEATTSAAYTTLVLSFDFKPVNGLDGSRIEVDLGRANGTDRSNFMVLEAVPVDGLRIAVNEAGTDGAFLVPNFSYATGNRTLVQGLDPDVFHRITLKVTYETGANNDLIEVYVDGEFVGSTTTFENFYDFGADLDPVVSRDIGQSNRLFFRGSNAGQPVDGPGGLNQGFYFDNLSGEDVFGTGNALDNVITGNRGNNVLAGLGGADSLVGGEGSDTADYSASGEAVTVSLATGLGLGGDAEGDVLMSIENLTGSDYNDTLTGDLGDNRLFGGEGEDLLVGGAGADTLSGGDDFDTATYASSTSAIVLDLTNASNSTGDAEGDIFFSIEQWIGTGFNDRMLGNSAANIFNGGAGSDTLDGGGGNDTLIGGAGADTLIGGDGIDTVDYSQESGTLAVAVNLTAGLATDRFGAIDTLSFIETIIATSGDDSLTGNSLNNLFFGLAGNDLLSGGDGADTLVGGTGRDIYVGGAGADVLRWDSLLEFAPRGTDLGVGAADIATDYVVADDTLFFDASIFAGAFPNNGTIAANRLIATDLISTAGNYAGSTGLATFVYDTVNNLTALDPQSQGALFFDAEGDGIVDFRIITFGSGSQLGDFGNGSGFTVNEIVIFGNVFPG